VSRPTRILGLSAYYHDSAAALIEDGRIVAAAQEERFTRIKGDAAFPHHAIAFCLDAAGIDESQLDYIVFYENPLTKFERLLTTYHLTAPRSFRSFLRAFPSWLTEKVWLENEIASEMGVAKRVYFCDHHLSHAASAFFPSPFERAAVLTIDGVGEWSTTTWGVGAGHRIELREQIRFPNSWGLLYSAFTYYTGFKINSGEYKLMGLAPYGEPRYADRIRDRLIRLGDDGSIAMNQRYFDYVGGLHMTNARFHELFEGPPREPESLITQREMDLAASVQVVLDEAVLRMARHVREHSGCDHLVLAGGVALNVVSVGRLASVGVFDELWVQPASGDAGGALGAALWMWHQKLGHPRAAPKPDAMQGAFLGSEIADASQEDDAILEKLGAVWDVCDEDALQERIARAIAAGKVVALARGRTEFGPRSLGARSILGDARLPSMQSHMNLKIKFRESFRPFAPMVIAEEARDWFDTTQESPYMLLVYPVTERRRVPVDASGLFGIDLLKASRSEVPAVTHVDHSARVQTVDAERNPFMAGVLRRFKAITGCPVIINTSFNVRGEPIVNTVEDAYRCFMATEIDCLVAGNRFLEREKQMNRPLDDDQRAQWLQRFELD
jgi:carbamoyltransferase